MEKSRMPKITLAAARVNAGYTQTEVASKLHVSNKTVLNWEKGISDMSYPTLKVLSDLYNMPIDFIFLPHEST